MVLDKIKQKIFGRKLAPSEVRSFLASADFKPVFFLSTGRCGTRWFTELLETNKKLSVHHNTAPELYEQSLAAYRLFKTQNDQQSEIQQLLSEIIFSARQDLMLDCVKNGHRFIETNNRISFFTPVLATIFPHAQFVHLYRDPAGFVKSGMNRDWYNDGMYDFARPSPVSGEEKQHWDNWSRVQKIAWLWRETNQMIDAQLEALPAERYRRFNFSELNTDAVTELLQWLEIDIRPDTISSRLSTKVNAQKKGNFPSFPDWSAKDQKDFLKQCGDYAKYLGFDYKS